MLTGGWLVGAGRVDEVVEVVGVVWVLRTKTSQQQEGLYLLLDHAAARLVKNPMLLPATPSSRSWTLEGFLN